MVGLGIAISSSSEFIDQPDSWAKRIFLFEKYNMKAKTSKEKDRRINFFLFGIYVSIINFDRLNHKFCYFDFKIGMYMLKFA